MKTISTTEELLSLIDVDGRLSEPVKVSDNCILSGLASVTNLDGLTLGDNCGLYDLAAVTSLDGLALGNDCALSGLAAVTSLDGLTLGSDCILSGLPETLEIKVQPSEEELKILRAIPIEKLKMDSWHCGTTHCLAGWAQIVCGAIPDRNTAFRDGQRLLPSMKPYFFAPQEAVERYLKSLHKEDPA
jgi:hypothetical protein